MLRAIVVDDERLTMELICRFLKNTGRVEVTGCYTDPFEALEQIFRQQPDVVFLDIEMPELNGLQLAEKIYESELQSEIVFVTAYNQYALDAFKVNALDYLLKPVAVKELERAVDRVDKRKPGHTRHVVETPGVRAAALGGFNIWTVGIDGATPIKWYTAKCKELMAYFILQGVAVEVSKWKLIELLWPDKDSEKGDTNLRSTLCRLNKTLKEYGTGMRIISNRNCYILKAASLTVDVLEMHKLAIDGTCMDQALPASYEAAIASYKGSLLEGYEYIWCEEQRVRCQRDFVTLCRRLADYYLEQRKDHASALSTVENWLRHEPYDGEAQCRALKLHFMMRGRVAAEAYYQSLYSMLEADLGIEPGDAVKALYSSIIE